jgi:hypothetical protein
MYQIRFNQPTTTNMVSKKRVSTATILAVARDEVNETYPGLTVCHGVISQNRRYRRIPMLEKMKAAKLKKENVFDAGNAKLDKEIVSDKGWRRLQQQYFGERRAD